MTLILPARDLASRPAPDLASVAVLREVKNARGRRGRFRAMCAEQQERPVALGDGHWAFEARIYKGDEALTSEDVLALVRERQRRAARTLERAHAALAGERVDARR